MDLVKVSIAGLVLCHTEATVVDPVGMEGTTAPHHALKNETIVFLLWIFTDHFHPAPDPSLDK